MSFFIIGRLFLVSSFVSGVVRLGGSEYSLRTVEPRASLQVLLQPGVCRSIALQVDFPERMSAALLLKLMVTMARFGLSALLSFQLSFIGLVDWNLFVVRCGLEAGHSS